MKNSINPPITDEGYYAISEEEALAIIAPLTEPEKQMLLDFIDRLIEERSQA